MGKVKSFNAEIIDKLSGIVDFYYWKGIPVARAWPKETKLLPSAAMLASQLAFKQSRLDLRQVSGKTRAAWADVSFGINQAWVDYYTMVYMRIWKEERRYPPVLTDFSIIEE